MIEKDFSQIVSKVVNDPACIRNDHRRQNIIDWDKIWAEVSEDASRYSYFLKFRNGILWIAVKNSAWVLELKKRKKNLLKMLRERTGVHINDINFTR